MSHPAPVYVLIAAWRSARPSLTPLGTSAHVICAEPSRCSALLLLSAGRRGNAAGAGIGTAAGAPARAAAVDQLPDQIFEHDRRLRMADYPLVAECMITRTQRN